MPTCSAGPIGCGYAPAWPPERPVLPQGPPAPRWCSATCGNRARAARHYRRHHRPVP
ncbi:CGNR zinc finger domain-containing protein [Actinoallomurus sp. NPDC052274]|uniref:CGNR zinc finger domain-containing protein n=1 Tax=Actinoallomurus sp. NPDC052274 TaxID=3155420 RepID=UPI00341CF938